MRNSSVIKKILIIAIIVLVSLISFAGIYLNDKNTVKNIMPEYKLGMDFAGYRKIVLDVNKGTQKINYDANGKIIESSDTETEIAKTEEKKINSEELLNKENYIKSKKVIENRLNNMKVDEYIIKQDENTGKIVVQVPENENADRIVSQLQLQGKFEIVDHNTNEVLMDNNDIKNVQAGYGTNSSGSTSVYINIQFNKEGTIKFKDITNKYIETEAVKELEEGTDETKTETVKKEIAIKIDGQELLTTYFEKEVSNGLLQLSVGSSSNNSDLQSYLTEASSMAGLIDSGNMPVVYENTQNKFVFSNLNLESSMIYIYIAIGIIILAIIYIIAKYRKVGIFASISLIGYIAVLLVILRCTNVVITLESLLGIAILIIINYVLLNILLKNNIKMQEEKSEYNKQIIKFGITIIPVIIIAIVFSFAGYLPLYSIGMVIFWGLLVNLLYNLVITRNLMIDTKK